jgi:hypothetical protein
MQDLLDRPAHQGMRRSRLGALVGLGALVASLLTSVGVAYADEFNPENSAPTVSSPSAPASISPDSGASDSEYQYSVTVGDADTLNDLSTVTLCLYLTTGGDSTCATPDPATDVKFTWSQATNSFALDSGSVNAYWALGSTTPSSAPTLTDTSGIFTFSFTVSEAMREGGWTFAVTADDGDATASDSTATTTVNHYSAITTRVQQDFGTIAAGSSASRTASPTVTSNGTTFYAMTAGDFSDGTYSFTLKTDGATSTTPSGGEVTFDCNRASAFDEASATRVGNTATTISASETTTGTVEGGVALDNACRLASGGQRPIGTYSVIAVNSVGNG